MTGRDELLGERLVVDSLSDLLGHELAQRRVGRFVHEHVAEVAHPDAEPRLRVQLLVEREPLVLRDLERLAPVRIVDEAAIGVAAQIEDLRVPPADRHLLVVADRAVAQGSAPVGGALEHGQVAARLRDLLDHLYTRRAGADDRDPERREVDRVARPVGGVEHAPAEPVDARQIRVERLSTARRPRG